MRAIVSANRSLTSRYTSQAAASKCIRSTK